MGMVLRKQVFPGAVLAEPSIFMTWQHFLGTGFSKFSAWSLMSWGILIRIGNRVACLRTDRRKMLKYLLGFRFVTPELSWSTAFCGIYCTVVWGEKKSVKYWNLYILDKSLTNSWASNISRKSVRSFRVKLNRAIWCFYLLSNEWA